MIRLSEAIRLGAMTYPLCRGRWFEGDAACLLTAALKVVDWETASKPPAYEVARPGGPRYTVVAAVKNAWPWTAEDPKGLPCTHFRAGASTDFIVHLFDSHERSAQQVADWVKTEERKRGLWDEQPATEPAVEEALSR